MLLVPVSYDWIKIEIIALMQIVLRVLAFILASPYSLLGLLLGVIGLCTGGRARIRGRTIEFHGGAVKWFVAHLLPGSFTLAITLGHTILGQSDASLDIARDHEMVHVRQFERWGPLMGPAYLLASLGLWFAGRNPYRVTLLNEKRIGRVEVNEHRTMSTGR